VPVLTMTVTQAKSMIVTLRRIAKDIADTAVGSSRVAMYEALATELRVEAAALECRIR